MKYFDKYKRDMFPDIEDWTGDQEQYRYMPKHKAAKSLKMKYWVFFCPSAYHLIMFGYQISTILIFGFLFIYSLMRVFNNAYFLIILIMSSLILFTVGSKFIEGIKYYKAMKNFNFYDLFMREG